MCKYDEHKQFDHKEAPKESLLNFFFLESTPVHFSWEHNILLVYQPSLVTAREETLIYYTNFAQFLGNVTHSRGHKE